MNKTKVCLAVASEDVTLDIGSGFQLYDGDEDDLASELGSTTEDTDTLPAVSEDTISNLLGVQKDESDDEDKDIFDTDTDKDKDKSGSDNDEDPDPKGGEDESSPYSSLLATLKEKGLLPDLDDEDIEGDLTEEDFVERMEKQMEARALSKFEDKERRMLEALEGGMEPESVKRFEAIISHLDSVSDETLDSDTDEAMHIRRSLIMQNFMNSGMSQEKAKRFTDRSFDAGTDIEDAKEALIENKTYFKSAYESAIKEGQEAVKEHQKAQVKKIEDFKKKVLGTAEPAKGVKVDPKTRQKILDNTLRASHKNDDGILMTPVQKYQSENPIDAQYWFSWLYTQTKGLTDFDGLVKSKVAAAKRKEISNITKRLQNQGTFRDSGNDVFIPTQDSEGNQSNLILDI